METRPHPVRLVGITVPSFRALALACVVLLVALPLTGCTKSATPMLSSKVPTPTAGADTPIPTPAAATVVAAATDAPATTSAGAPTDTAVVQPTSTTQPTDTPPPPTNTVPPADTATPAPTLTATTTVTPTATATLTITAGIRLVVEPACENELVRIMGIAVKERTVEFTGTAAIGNFAYFKFEYQGASEADWHYIDRSETPVDRGILYAWDTSMLAPGIYRVNLIAVDNTGNYPAPCSVEIEIIE